MLGGQTTGMTGPGDNRNPPNPASALHPATTDNLGLFTTRTPFASMPAGFREKMLSFGEQFGLRPLSAYNDRVIFQATMDGPERRSYGFSEGELVQGLDKLGVACSAMERTGDLFVFKLGLKEAKGRAEIVQHYLGQGVKLGLIPPEEGSRLSKACVGESGDNSPLIDQKQAAALFTDLRSALQAKQVRRPAHPTPDAYTMEFQVPHLIQFDRESGEHDFKPGQRTKIIELIKKSLHKIGSQVYFTFGPTSEQWVGLDLFPNEKGHLRANEAYSSSDGVTPDLSLSAMKARMPAKAHVPVDPELEKLHHALAKATEEEQSAYKAYLKAPEGVGAEKLFQRYNSLLKKASEAMKAVIAYGHTKPKTEVKEASMKEGHLVQEMFSSFWHTGEARRHSLAARSAKAGDPANQYHSTMGEFHELAAKAADHPKDSGSLKSKLSHLLDQAKVFYDAAEKSGFGFTSLGDVYFGRDFLKLKKEISEGVSMKEQRFAGAYAKAIGRNRIGDMVRVLAADSEAFQRIGTVMGYDLSNPDRPLVVQFQKPIIQHGEGELKNTENYATDELELVRRAMSLAGESHRIINAALSEDSVPAIKGLSRGGEALELQQGGETLLFRPHGVPFDARELLRRFEKMLAHGNQKDAMAWLRQSAVVVNSGLDSQAENKIAQAIQNRSKGRPLAAVLATLNIGS